MIGPAAIERFEAGLARLWMGPGRFGLAVSGGPDSLAMLLLAHRACPGMIEAATVDHGLRPESADEAAMVARVCAERGISHCTLPVRLERGNLQARARDARYAALGVWALERGLDVLVTAHHADDQAETVLMRLNRGSGLAGLSGVRARSEICGQTVLRPLLAWRKAELQAVCDAAGLSPAKDASNEDPDFDRVRIRQAIADSGWLDPGAMAQSAVYLAEALAVVEQSVDAEWEERVEPEEGGYRYRPGDSPYLSGEIVGRIVDAMEGSVSRAEAARMRDRLTRGDNASLDGVLATCGTVMDDGAPVSVWRFRREPARRSG